MTCVKSLWLSLLGVETPECVFSRQCKPIFVQEKSRACDGGIFFPPRTANGFVARSGLSALGGGKHARSVDGQLGAVPDEKRQGVLPRVDDGGAVHQGELENDAAQQGRPGAATTLNPEP